jgi:protease-4
VTLRRGFSVFFTLVGVATVLSIVLAFAAYLASGRGPSVPEESVLVMRPGGELVEVVPDDVVGQVLGGETATVRGFIESLQKARRDPRITAVLLLPSTLDLPFWGKVQELRDAIVDFRRSGKSVVAFLEYGGDREYYLASAADRVFLLPTSPLDLTGIASYEVFLRGALDKLGAYPDFVHVGAYKTAVNQFTEKGFTPEHREMTGISTSNSFAVLRKPGRRLLTKCGGCSTKVRSRPRRHGRLGWSTNLPTSINSTTASRR